MKRGEVWRVAFDPAIGGEIQKTRPAVIISNDEANRHQNRVQVIPLTGNPSPARPWEALVRIGSRTSKAQADQIKTVAKERVSERLALVTRSEMKAIEQAVRVQLDL